MPLCVNIVVSEVPHIDSSDSKNSENDVGSLVSKTSTSCSPDKDAEEPIENVKIHRLHVMLHTMV